MRILLLTCPRCLCLRLLGVRFSHSLTTAVCDSVLSSWEAAKMLVLSARFSPQKKTANLGSKDFQSEVTLLAAKNSVKRRFPVVGPECALLGSGRTEKR